MVEQDRPGAKHSIVAFEKDAQILGFERNRFIRAVDYHRSGGSLLTSRMQTAQPPQRPSELSQGLLKNKENSNNNMGKSTDSSTSINF